MKETGSCDPVLISFTEMPGIPDFANPGTSSEKTYSTDQSVPNDHLPLPQQFLNFLPLPQGQGSFLPTRADRLRIVSTLWD